MSARLFHEAFPGQPLTVAVRLPSMPVDEAAAVGRLVAACPEVSRLTLDTAAECVVLLLIEDSGDLRSDIAGTIDRAVRAWLGS